MKALRKIAIVAIFASGLVTLSGCGSVPLGGASAKAPTWFNTDLGSVKCIEVPAAFGYHTTSCDWGTLRSGEAQANAEHLDGDYQQFDGQRVYCIENQLSHSYKQYDCNWQGR